MKKSFSQKHPYAAVILIGLLCMFMTALGTAVPQIMKLDSDIQLLVTVFFLIISIAIGIIIMKRSRFSISEYGFRKSKKGTYRKIGWFIPLIAIEILPLAVTGFRSEAKGLQYMIILLFTIAVGFNEEIYFRGLALKFMKEKGNKKAIIWTSAVFGVLHLINVLNGKKSLYLVLQMLFAFLVGFVLAELVSITKSLWILIIWHAAHDYISMITGDVLDVTALMILAIQVGILFTYALCIWRLSNAEDMVKERRNHM